ILYVSDSRFLPYGEKDEEFVRERSALIADCLIRHGATTIVIACNTATAAAAESLRARLTVPVVGIEPAVKPAAAATRSGIVGILATASTLQSRRYAELLSRHGGFARVIGEPCPGLVERVEQGDLDGPVTCALLQRHITPLLAAGADTLVLGCTHFPFLREAIERIAGPAVTVVDPSDAVARRLAELLATPVAGSGAIRAFSSGDCQAQSRLMSRLLGFDLPVEPMDCVEATA
ncbi:MAG: glutamate racemase, partial [Gammaproteobacteria bacterium]